MSASRNPAAAGWIDVLGEMIEGARDALFRFPVTALFLLALAFYANFEIAGVRWFRDFDWYLPMALTCAATASLAATLFFEARGGMQVIGQGAAVVAGALAWLAIWYSGVVLSHEFVLLAALAGLALVAPYLWRFSASAFWLFAVRFAFAVVLGILALLLTAGGLSAILASLDYLFGVDIDSDIYGHVWATTGLFIAPLFGLGRLPRWFHDEPSASEQEYMSIGIRALGDFVAAPLLLIYAIILHVYAAKIVVTGEVPKGQIGWLVLAYGFCLFGSLLISYPYWRLARAPMRLLLRVWPFVLPVPLAMLLYAAWLRIGQYGVTPERYLLVLYALVAGLIVIVQLFKPLRGDIRLIVAIPVIALCLASFGPQGVTGLSVSSQVARFKALLADVADNVQKEGEAVSVLIFLQSYGGLGRVAPEDVELKKRERSGRNAYEDMRIVAKAYGLNPDLDTSAQTNLAFHKFFNANEILPVAGFDRVVPEVHLYNNLNSVAQHKTAGGKGIVFKLTDTSITLTTGDETTIFGLSESDIQGIAGADGMKPHRLELVSGGKKIAFYLQQANGERHPETRMINMSGLVMLRSADWE